MQTPTTNSAFAAVRGKRSEGAQADAASAPRTSAAPWYNAKYSSIQQNQGFQPVIWADGEAGTGEIIPLVQEETDLKKRYEPQEARLERFALQSAARKLLWGSRTAKCLRLVRSRRKDDDRQPVIEVWRSIEHGSAHYSGLQTCGSVWACPVCAAKVSEVRRLELLRIMEKHKAKGGACYLLTLTNPHMAGDDLGQLLKAQALAMSRFNSNRSAKALWAEIDCAGTVRAQEVTHGLANGWHPHFHVLVFARSGLNLVEYRRRFYAEWANACRLAKLPAPSYEHGVRLDGGNEASKYVTKGLWGLDYEMTKSHVKKASKGRSPFDLLRSYLYDDDKQAAALFREYAAAFHGKRQLQYSNGLKDLYAVEDLTDDEIINQHDETADLLGQIEFEQWRLILAADLRGEVLELARHGWEPVARLLASLTDQEKRKVHERIKREKEKNIEISRGNDERSMPLQRSFAALAYPV
jgi:hypothetical protein